MLGLAEAKPSHARWAQANGDFLEFVARHPEYQARASFGTMLGVEWLRQYSPQPWPLFVDVAQRRELEVVALGVDRLMKDTMSRFFQRDPAEVAAFYAANNPRADENFETFTPDEDFLAMLLEEPDGIEGAPSRGDYIEDAEGLKLVEYNSGGFLGGLQIEAVGDLCAATAPTARFLAEQGRRARPPATLRAMFRHMIEDTVRSGAWPGGELNLALMLRPHEPAELALYSSGLYEREYQRALEEGGIASSGRLLLCGAEDLVEEDGFLAIDGHRLHALAELHDGNGDVKLPFRYFKMGRLNLFSGPIGSLMSDKRNLALISEQADSDEFTGAERELIRRHIPWTRRVLPRGAGGGGGGIRVPHDLLARREELVLKKASSIGGRYVRVGKFHTDVGWSAVVEGALHDGDWIVQEYLETVPYCFLNAAADAAGRHDMVWGLFVFGDHYGGALLRMQPVGSASGVVNIHQGAEIGVMLDLDG
jgi:hypothetical protein